MNKEERSILFVRVFLAFMGFMVLRLGVLFIRMLFGNWEPLNWGIGVNIIVFLLVFASIHKVFPGKVSE